MSLAAVDQIYTSNGIGSGTWKKVGSSSLLGLSGDGGVAERKVVSNGTGGFLLKADSIYGSQTITNNSVVFPGVAVLDTTFNTPSQYSLLTGVGVPWLSENLNGISFATDALTVSVTGIYLINLWMNVVKFPNASAKISIRHRLNGTGAFSTRKPTVKSAIAGDASQLVGFGLLPMTAGDFLQLYIATDTTGDIILSDVNNTLHLIRQTA